MVDGDTAWVMYAADYDTGRQHSRIIPDSVRVLRTATREITLNEVQAERERTGLDNRLHTIQIELPAEVSSENLAAYAERYISLEPEFNFWDDVIGDDIVVAGIAYDGDRYAPDGEGGVRPLTEAERAAREATIRQREAEREAEQTARETERRRQAIEYATQGARQQAATVITETAQAAPATGSHQNTADRAATAADSARIPTAQHLSDLQERSAHLRSWRDTEAPGSGRTADTWEAELEAADALADAPDWVRNGWPDPTEQEPDVGP